MSLIDSTCPSCSHTFRVPARPVARRVKCPKCGSAVAIEGSAAAAPVTEEASSQEAPAAPSPERKSAAGASKGARPRSTSGSRGARSAPAKKSPLPLVLAGVGVLVVVGGWLMFRGGESKGTAKAQEAPAVPKLELADLAPLDGTTEEDWKSLNDLVTKYITPPWGKESEKAGDRLMNQGKRSVPAILNGFKRLDLSSKESVSIGWKVQTLLLQGLCHGTNFGWVKETRPQDILENQKVIRRWFESWEKARDDDQKWILISEGKDVPAPSGG